MSLVATVLTDPHKHGPAHYGLPSLYLMTDDQQKSETLAPPTDREAPTNPHASLAPAPRTALRPPPADPWDTSFLDADDSVFSRAVRMIADAARANERDAEERRLFERQAQSNHEATIEAILKADANSSRNYAMIRDEIRHLKESDLRQDRRLADGDQRFTAIERSIADLKDELIALITRATAEAAKRLEALEGELAAAKASRDAAATPT